MYDRSVRDQARAQVAQGRSLRSISLATGIARSTLRDWRDLPDRPRPRADCPRCGTAPQWDGEQAAYAYLLGLYLGDGCISPAGRGDKGVWLLRIACADAWPGLLEECAQAIRAIRPDNRIGAVHKQGCADVTSYSKHWPCFFPQHGPGRKHERRIELEPWQQEIVAGFPGELARGLFHSDGCRIANRVRRPLPSGDRWYEYPRYFFVNQSRDILGLCGEALDRLGVAWRFSKPNTISVARRDAVARLDESSGRSTDPDVPRTASPGQFGAIRADAQPRPAGTLIA